MALPGGASESEIHICARSHSHTHTHTYTHAHTHTHTSTHTLSQPQSSGQTPPPVSPTRNWRGTGASLADLRHPPEALAGEVSSVAQDGGGPRSVGALELASPLWRSPLPFALGPHSVVVEENIHRRNGFFSGPSTQPPSRTTPPPSLTPATQGVRRPVMVAPTPVQGKTDIKAQLGPFTAPTSASPSPTPGSLQPQRRREGALARPGSESRLVLPSLASSSPTELLGGGTHVPSPSQGLGGNPGHPTSRVRRAEAAHWSEISDLPPDDTSRAPWRPQPPAQGADHSPICPEALAASLAQRVRYGPAGPDSWSSPG